MSQISQNSSTMVKRNPLLIEEADKTHFKCLQLPDMSIYYGEVYHVDDNNNPVDILNPPTDDEEEENPDEEPELDEEGNPIKKKKVYKMVRHGLGAQLFGASGNKYLCKYEGYWDRDKKHGEGKCTYPDNSVYWGDMKHDIRDGWGQFTWANGNQYEGQWKNNRMEG